MKFEGFCSRIALSTVVCSACLAVGACGGGGSPAPSPSPSPPPANTKPVLTSASTVSVVENTTAAFYTATASDPQNDPITIELFSGPDADKLVMDADGNLRFNENPNYDLPIDANLDNTYEVTLRVSAGGESQNFPVRISVTNDREGVVVTRVAEGLVDPVAISPIPNEPTLLIAERDGRVFRFATDTNTLTEDLFIRDNRRQGEILSISFGFVDRPYQEGIYIVTHSATEGLMIQAFDPSKSATGFRTLGPSWASPTTVSMIRTQTLMIAVGSPEEAQAQDASSPYGKLIELALIDPYSGASLPRPETLILSPETIGDGIQRPGGFSPAADFIYLADQGSTTEHELTIFRKDWRPLDFGWPFYEGAQEVRTNAPQAVNGPTLVYNVGEGFKEGDGIIAGLLNDYRFLPELGDNYIFADLNGTIFSVPRARLVDGFRHTTNVFEDKSEDFVPDVGLIDNPIAISGGSGTDSFYILDADGELFRVEGS